MALDFIGGVILIAAVVVNIGVFANALGISQSARIGLVAAGGVWTGLQLSLYAAGAYQSPVVQTFPLVGPMVVLPPSSSALPPAFGRVRATLLAVPTELLIGLNAMRVFGGPSSVLGRGRPAQRAVPLLRRLGRRHCRAGGDPARHARRPRLGRPGAIFGWNVFAALDLVAAVTLGTLSSEGFVDADVHRRPGSTAVQHMPWLLIPTVLVPFYLITHGIIFAQLRQRRVAAVAA